MIRCRGAVLAAAVCGAFAIGCSSNNNNNNVQDAGPDAGPGGSDGGLRSGMLTSTTASANGAAFTLPLDAVPSPDGSNLYFIGVDPASQNPAVFKTAAAASSTASAIATGGNLGAPLGIAISTDGNTLYIADPGATTSSGHDKGVIFTLASGGGTPAELAGSLDYAPRAVTVAHVNNADAVYFIGTDKATGHDGVFSVTTSAATSVLSGGNPQAIAVATDGTVYVLDQAGTISKVAAGQTTGTALAGVTINTPGGMDIAQDQSALLVSGFDSTGKEAVLRVPIAGGAATALTLTPALTGKEPGGVHRAPNADDYAFVDTGAGNSGTIYLLK